MKKEVAIVKHNKNEEITVFDADRPIVSVLQDKLNRANFAKYLARCLLDHTDPDSLVVGLTGGWGVGKTSIINLVVEEFKFASSNLADDEKPIILNFSPWSYSGQHQLIYSFFRRLSSVLREEPLLENKEQIIPLLELYVSYFTHQPIPKSLRQKDTWFKKWLFRRKSRETTGWESGRDLTMVKAELNTYLRNQKRHIFIIIDNISRMAPDEIKEIFQIVKSIGDYNNTRYLLAFDKKQVIEALNRHDGGGGEEYVEKVVQLPFEVPAIAPQDLEGIFADRLKPILQWVPAEAWQTEAWASLYYSSLKYFFHHCRDITRYVNALHFSYPRLKDVVNPVDFFGLTALEVFAPEVYQGVRGNKDLFTDLMETVYPIEMDEAKREQMRCDEIIHRAERINHAVIQDLLIKLFPRLQKIYHPDQAVYHSNAVARQLKRICSPDLFDVYFRLSMPSGVIPHAEFETILKLANTPLAFDQALARLNQDDRILQFLNQFDEPTIKKIPFENTQAIINALLDNGDLFPEGIGGLLSLDTATHIHRIIHGLLMCYDNAEIRVLFLEKAIKNATNSLAIIIHEINAESIQHHELSDTESPTHLSCFTAAELDRLKKSCVEQIKAWAKDGRLETHPKLRMILEAWENWGNEEDVRAFIAKMTESDKGLVAFLTAMLANAINDAVTTYEKSPNWERDLAGINVFIPADSLVEHANLLFKDNYFEKLREREQLSIMIFLDLMKSSVIKVQPNTAD